MRGAINGQDFDIPDEWWDGAGMFEFVPSGCAFSVERQANEAIYAVLVSDIAPPKRNPGIEWFSEARMRNILHAFSMNRPLPAVEVREKTCGPFRYQVYDGFHRFYASAAAGFSHLPVTIRPVSQL